MSELSDRRRSGYFSSIGLAGELTDGETLSCVHCGYTWILKKGSGRARGFCLACNGFHCGGPTCWDCVPLERRIENMEAGRSVLSPAPPLIVVPALEFG